MNKIKTILTFLVALAILITAPSAIGMSEEGYVSPYQGIPSDWPDYAVEADTLTSGTLWPGGQFSYLTNDGLRVGMDDGHFADYTLGYGFRWPDHSNYEALAVGWLGEGFTIGYSGGAVLYSSYESGRWGSYWSPTTETEIPFTGGTEYYVAGSVCRLWLEQSTIIYDDEHDAALKITISNPSDSTISGIRYKRMVDWDVDLRVSPTGFANYWDYFTLSDGAEVQTATGTKLHAWGKYHQAALVVSGAGCSELPTLHDQNGWGDRGWRTYVNSPDRNGRLVDDAALFQWDFSLAPGESYEIMLFYLIDDTTGWTDTANIVADYEELFGKVCIPPVIEVDVDIKPGSCPNPLNKKSKGVLPVAVLGTDDFDVMTIDPSTIQLSREDVEEGVAPIRWNYEDVATPFEGELCDCHDLDGDGILDLTLKFSTQDLVEKLDLCPLDGQTIPLTITGNLKEENGGTPIEGEDCIWVLKQGKK